ncbi:hypothetical protein C8R44DRAFT_793630 [Mycena epipterygia]|nr:hypothetical protein C8R44DRAFT_793630 [Mycena epipterygia]
MHPVTLHNPTHLASAPLVLLRATPPDPHCIVHSRSTPRTRARTHLKGRPPSAPLYHLIVPPSRPRTHVHYTIHPNRYPRRPFIACVLDARRPLSSFDTT